MIVKKEFIFFWGIFLNSLASICQTNDTLKYSEFKEVSALRDSNGNLSERKLVNSRDTLIRLKQIFTDSIVRIEIYSNLAKEYSYIVYYFDNSKIHIFQEFKGAKVNGKYREYNRFGEIIIEGNYINDKKYGLWKYYKHGRVYKTRRF